MAASNADERATRSMVQRWQQLSKEIAAQSRTRDENHDSANGSLLILGSGISHRDLTIADEAEIVAADAVFHCTNDRLTRIWVEHLRPDALDLRILYRDEVDRHATYVCMAEAILFRVRRGERVVAIFYGHPGIFATPTHRAMQIARKEGYSATMRPGISALDHLIADVGFDPMIPGLASYEASDVLLSRRDLDSSVHMVLWQVGMVGEYQFQSQGFANRGLADLVAEIKSAYGEDWPVIHYISPQYIGIAPVIDRLSCASLLSPKVAVQINAMSTFYIPPRHEIASPKDRRPARTRVTQRSELVAFDLADYGPFALESLVSFGSFEAPSHFRSHHFSPAAVFLIAVSRDPALRIEFERDTDSAIERSGVPGISARARALLKIRHTRAFNAAIAEPRT